MDPIALAASRDDRRTYDGEHIKYVMPQGSYCIGTKYTDGDPGDAWGVGYYLESFYFPGDDLKRLRHRIVGNDGVYLYGPKGFIKIRGRLRSDVGFWLVNNCKILKASPPGSVNLWGMLTEQCFEVEEQPTTSD